MRDWKSIAALLLVVLPGGFAGIWRLQHGIDNQLQNIREAQDEVLLSSPRMMKAVSLEYAPLMADIYWTRVVQYYGSKGERREQNLDSLWILLNLSTTLDPNLLPAYRFGSTFLAEERPVGLGRPDLAIELIERGIHENPQEWRLYQDLGNIYYFALHDNQKASQAYVNGGNVPGAQPWMRLMAARIVERGDTRQTSRLLWSEIYESSTDQAIKENAKTHLLLLKTDDDIEQLNLLIAEFQKKYGHPAVHMHELIEAGMLRALPADPDGFAYVIGKSGKAELNPAGKLAKLEPLYRRF